MLEFKFVHFKKSFKKKTFRIVLRQSCAAFCRNLRICNLRIIIKFADNNKNLRICNMQICDSGMSPRIYGFAICGLLKMFPCPPLLRTIVRFDEP